MSRRSLCLSLISAAEDATLTFSSAQPRAEVISRVTLNNCWPLCCGSVLGAEVMKVSISEEILVCRSEKSITKAQEGYQNTWRRLRAGG